LHLLRLNELELGGFEVFVGLLQVRKRLLQLILVPGQIFVGFLQGFFREFAFGDITTDADQAGYFPSRLRKGNFGGGMPAMIPEAVRHEFLTIQQRLSGSEDAFVVGGESRHLPAGKEVRDLLANHLAFRSAPNQRRCAMLSSKVTAVDVLDVNVIRQVIDQRTEQVPFGLQLLLDFLELGNIAADPEVADDLALAIFEGQLAG
jgi:hypothetical protein